ncbi:helix-turn-helix transcriptional regulator [Acinetobacter baumannii]
MEKHEINIKDLEREIAELRKFDEDHITRIENTLVNKVFITNANEIFGHMMRLIRKNLGLTQEEMGLILGREQFTYSKAGYSKLERGDTGINIDFIFHLSNLTGLSHVTIFSLYSEIINAIFHNKFKSVQFDPIIGQYGMGTFSQKPKKITEDTQKKLNENKKNEQRYWEIDKMLGKENINAINTMLNENINPFIRNNIKISVERAVSLKLNKGIKINIPKSIYNGKE